MVEKTNIFLLIILTFVSHGLFAQVDAELLLELTKASTTDMNATTPVKGTLIYNVDDDKIYQFDGTSWANISEDGDWTRSGNNQYSAVIGNVGIGIASPVEKLDVQGNIVHSGRMYSVRTIQSNGDPVYINLEKSTSLGFEVIIQSVSVDRVVSGFDVDWSFCLKGKLEAADGLEESIGSIQE